MEKIVALILAAFMSVMPGSVTKKYIGSSEITGNYAVHVGSYDWGCSVDKIILSLSAPIDIVNADDFKVQSEKDTNNWRGQSYHAVEELKVSKAYLCNEKGEKTEDSSPYVVLEIEVSPDKASPLAGSAKNAVNIYADPYQCTIVLSDTAKLKSKGIDVKSFVIDMTMTKMTTDADVFKLGHYQSTTGINYDYATYTPEQKSDTLVVWLHGLGEGATNLTETEKTNPYIACLSAEVTALAESEFQSALRGANLLVPQCPTYWMDSDGKCSNLVNGTIHADGSSYYTESLHELIEAYKTECGAKNVLIAGCSNGGYMGMVLAKNYTSEYDGYILICEAMPSECLSASDLQKIKDLPMYFIYSEDDPLVVPSEYEAPTIQRLRAMGAKNLHVSTTKSVIDLSGKYTDVDGTPHKYFGHNSWIYFFNNETSCNECGIDAWSWMAQQLS